MDFEVPETINSLLYYSPQSFIVISLLTIVIYRLPIIGKIFRSLHTLVHETGHSLSAFLTSGSTLKMELSPDMSGVTVTKSSGKLQQIFISLAGYPVASVLACLSCWLLVKEQYTYLLSGLLILVAFQLLLNIRNTYGILWAISTIAILFVVLWWQKNLEYVVSVIITNILLTESVISSGIVFIQSMRKPDASGDATNLAKATRIPAFFWGLLFFTQSLFFLWKSITILMELMPFKL